MSELSSTKYPPCGWIGLGLMGLPMARHLAAQDMDLCVHNRSVAAVELLKTHHAVRSASSPFDLARQIQSGVIFLMLTDTPAVRQVILGENGLIKGLTPGTLVIDMSTTAVDATRELALLIEAAGGQFLDAPVSGGQVGAQDATLSIMAGGSSSAFDRALPLLQFLGRRITHMGPVGSGQITKLANQIIVALTIDAVAEALALAQAAGVDPARVRDAIRGGFAESRILDLQGGKMVTGSFEPGGRATGQLKDVREAARLAEEFGMNLPGLQQNLHLWQRLVDQGYGAQDHSVLFAMLTDDLNRSQKQKASPEPPSTPCPPA